MDAREFARHFEAAAKAIVPCVLCGSRDFAIATDRDRHDSGLCTAVCRHCGLAQTNPRPSADWYNRFYSELYWPLYIGSRARDLEDLFAVDYYLEKGSLVGKRIRAELGSERARFLDFGCGLGGLVSYLRAASQWQVEAVEPGIEAAQFVTRRTGVRVHACALDQLPDTEPYDAIALVHVLEHTLDPIRILRSIRERLAPGGIAYIEVPDLMSRKWRGPQFFHVAHACAFDRKTLGQSIEAAGMTVTRMIRSPAAKYWPWAIGAFARRSGKPVQPVPRITESEFKRRMAWVARRVAAEPGLLERVAAALGPGFPGPRTWRRLLGRR